jgi:zinc transporter ZupT
MTKPLRYILLAVFLILAGLGFSGASFLFYGFLTGGVAVGAGVLFLIQKQSSGNQKGSPNVEAAFFVCFCIWLVE